MPLSRAPAGGSQSTYKLWFDLGLFKFILPLNYQSIWALCFLLAPSFSLVLAISFVLSFEQKHIEHICVRRCMHVLHFVGDWASLCSPGRTILVTLRLLVDVLGNPRLKVDHLVVSEENMSILMQLVLRAQNRMLRFLHFWQLYLFAVAEPFFCTLRLFGLRLMSIGSLLFSECCRLDL